MYEYVANMSMLLRVVFVASQSATDNLPSLMGVFLYLYPRPKGLFHSSSTLLIVAKVSNQLPRTQTSALDEELLCMLVQYMTSNESW